MAARLNTRHSDSCRSRIRTSQLINRLQDEALGKIALTQGQRDSAKFLILQSLAPLPQSVETDGKLTIEFKGFSNAV